MQYSTEVGRSYVILRQEEIWMIGHIETFETKLNLLGLPDFEILEQRKIQNAKRRTANNVASGIAELTGVSLWIKPLESIDVEPSLHRMGALVWIADEIGTVG